MTCAEVWRWLDGVSVFAMGAQVRVEIAAHLQACMPCAEIVHARYAAALVKPTAEEWAQIQELYQEDCEVGGDSAVEESGG